MADDVLPVVVDLPFTTKVREEQGRRIIYTKASVENGKPDRQDEIVAVDALWASRDLFIEQGDLDIAHWAHLPNPLTGRPDLEYRIGVPLDVKRDEDSIYVKGEIFQPDSDPLPESSGHRADLFWYALYHQNPPARYFPSVYGTIKGVEIVEHEGRFVRRLSNVEWTNIGFHNRVQHPDVPPVSLAPLGPFAKADRGFATNAMLQRVGGIRMTFGTFAKALTVGLPVETNTAARTGLQALMPEQVEKERRKVVAKAEQELTYKRAKVEVARGIVQQEIPTTRDGIKMAFLAVGCSEEDAESFTRRFLTEARRTIARRR